MSDATLDRLDALAAAHVKTYASEMDEAWDHAPICSEDRRPWPCDVALAVVPAAAALRAVLAPHRPVEVATGVSAPNNGPIAVTRTTACEWCRRHTGLLMWPCEHVAAITEHLGAEGADRG